MRTCLTEDQVKNGMDGFTVASFKENTEPPKSILAPKVKTFVCIMGPRDCPGDWYFVFMKNGVAGESKSANDSSSESVLKLEMTSKSFFRYSIEKWFFMVAILTIYKLF
ncbi:unnamed protein product [Caenorhabditis nigoni]